MSDDSENQAFANFFGACCTNAATALLVYDFTITFDNEVTLFWMERQLSGAFFLFLTNRYLTLVAQIINVLPVLSSAESEYPLFVVSVVFTALQYLPWAAFAALRSYALCPDPYQRLVSASVFTLSSVSVVVILLANLYGLSIIDDPTEGFALTFGMSPSTDTKLTVVTRCCAVASDLLVLWVTWYQTHETVRLSGHSHDRGTFASILLLNGIMYFLVLFIVNVLQMVFTVTGVAALPANTSSAISILEIPLTSILTSRFLISLQKFQRKTMGSSTDVSLGEVVFQPQTSSRFIGSLGAQLSVYEDDDGENDSETGDGDVS